MRLCLPLIPVLLCCAVSHAAAPGDARPHTQARIPDALRADAQARVQPIMLHYGRPSPVVDLGVGLWATPLPLDWDGDGDLDLLVSCTDKPYNGMWLFRNHGVHRKWPVFEAAGKVGPGLVDAQVSYVDGHARVLVRHEEYLNFRENGFTQKRALCPEDTLTMPPGRTRARDWKLVDFDGDGHMDLVAGIGYWEDYGWDDGYDAQGNWLKGPLRGYVYLMRNNGSTYEASVQLRTTDGAFVETFGKPVPNFADFDNDGDLDLLCGEFVDSFTYFENTGTRTAPAYAPGRKLMLGDAPLTMELCMIVPVALDWDGDGDTDLVVGDEDGRIALVEHTGRVVEGLPQFSKPRYFQQRGGPVKFGALATPFAVDWDGDGDVDLLSGNTAGHIALLENKGGGTPPRLAPPRLLHCEGGPIHIQAGPNGSIQGPAERKWGYTVFTAADWDGDGNTDLIVNSIWGRVEWYRNARGRGAMELEAPRPLDVAWEGGPIKPAWVWWEPRPDDLVTQWRTTPFAIDWNRDGLCDLVMLDHEGYLAFFERFRAEDGALRLRPGRRIFTGADGNPLRLNERERGKSGRRKFTLADWDGDGAIDLILNSISANFWRNTSADPIGAPRFEDQGPLTEVRLEGHDTCPTTVDWNGDGRLELVIGAEDGHYYYLP
jgi:hypothetical protein